MKASGDAAIIGHGRSPEDKGWGKQIDQCDYVLRLWDWTWQPPIDYGSRFDIGMYEIAAPHMKQFMTYNDANPTLHWIAVIIKHNSYFGPLVAGTDLFDISYWEEMGKIMGAEGGCKPGVFRFQRGAVLACYAMVKLPITRCILVGHDNTRAREAMSIEEGHNPIYVDSPVCLSFRDYEPGLTKYGHHDYAMEGEVLSKIAHERSIELVHAQDIW